MTEKSEPSEPFDPIAGGVSLAECLGAYYGSLLRERIPDDLAAALTLQYQQLIMTMSKSAVKE